MARAEDRPARFLNLAVGAQRTPIEFALAKVDEFNRWAELTGLETVRYQAYSVNYGTHDGLEFRFLNLSEDQFYWMRALYGDFSRSIPRSGRHDYELTDFLPPSVQALVGHSVHYGYGRLESPIEPVTFEESRKKSASLSWHVFSGSNCFGTAIDFVRSGQFTCDPLIALHTVLFVDRLRTEDVFTRLGRDLGTVAIPDGTPIADLNIPGLQTGNVLLFFTQEQLLRNVQLSAKGTILSSSPGSVAEILQHAAFWIDRGLVFEKRDAGDDDPYRLTSLEEAARPYRRRLRIGAVSFPRAFPEITEEIHNLQTAPFLKPMGIVRPPDHLRRLLVLNTELLFPHEGEFYHSWSQAVPLGLAQDPETGRYALPPEAYETSTFDVRENAKRLCQEALQKAADGA